MTMMPPGGFRRIDGRYIHPTSYKVDPANLAITEFSEGDAVPAPYRRGPV
jgi:hypothetical protein